MQIQIYIYVFKCADVFCSIHFTGVFSSSGLLATGFLRSKYQPSMRKNPYLQYIIFGVVWDKDYACNAGGLKPEVCFYLVLIQII